MESMFSNEVLLAIITAVSGGVAFLVKYILNKRDEAQKRVFEERDRDKEEMKANIEELKTEVKETKKEVKGLWAMIAGCEHEDCPNRKLLKEKLENG